MSTHPLLTPLTRAPLTRLLSSRLFFTPAFALYAPVAGLFDLGPPATALQANIINTWRRHFVIEEEMLELDTTVLTPEAVLKTSGHVDKFTDLMVKDLVTGEFFRADHLVENELEGRLQAFEESKIKAKGKNKEKLIDEATAAEYQNILAQIDNYDADALADFITRFDINSPENQNKVSTPEPFNLMFQTSIGPTGHAKAYLRPETAQGQFMNFNKLLEYNNHAMPFASAQIGKSFRNEISPRQGVLRVREFTMAEIEHFVHPDKKSHPRFEEVKDLELPFLDKHTQEAGESTIKFWTVGKAVSSGMVDNETLGYFLARIYLFLTTIGTSKDKLRFRQHMSNEMAHYASDCWDAELETSYGWIECVGCADRSAYDLEAHSAKSSEKLTAQEKLPEPRTIQKTIIEINKKKFGPSFKSDGKQLITKLESFSEEQIEQVKQQLQSTGEYKLDGFVLTKDHISVQVETKVEHTQAYTPHVIEPSFGIGRILYCMIEHVFWSREADEQRCVLSLPALVAPYKCLLVPLSKNMVFKPLLSDISRKLRNAHLACKLDDSATSIGKRYARNDELGTPFGITIDFQSVKDNTVTLRERDSTQQIRQTIDQVVHIVSELTNGKMQWSDVIAANPLFEGQQLEEA